MMDLFTLAPFSDEDTSREAAKRIVPHIERLERSVLVAGSAARWRRTSWRRRSGSPGTRCARAS